MEYVDPLCHQFRDIGVPPCLYHKSLSQAILMSGRIRSRRYVCLNNDLCRRTSIEGEKSCPTEEGDNRPEPIFDQQPNEEEIGICV